MTRPLLGTKLHPPTSSHARVGRPRLTRLLEEGARSRLTLVSAPPGFGKTSLVADWLASSETQRAAAWLSLDAADNERTTFWTYVAAALAGATPGRGSRARAVLETAGSSVEAALTELLNELAAHDGQIVLVLDDLHAIDDPRIADDLAFVLERLPAQVHVIATTRADPALPLARLRARGQLVEIRAADLRFTTEEAAAFLNGTMALALSEPDVAALEGRTEGWIAALQLAAVSLRGRDDPRDFIASFAGDDRYIVDYLADEVLARQPADIRAFLLETAILDRISGSLADAVTGRDDGTTVLAGLDRANLFLIALDDRRRWYRYHHLFADLLRARLLDERPGEVASLHRRASGWFERNGEPREAIRHALAGEDVERAAELIELELPGLRRSRDELALRDWLGALPDHLFETRPVLAAGRAGALMQTGDFTGVEALLDSVERALASSPAADATPDGIVVVDRDELRKLPAAVAMYRAALGRIAGDIEATMSHARRAIEVAEADDPLGRGGPAALLGLALWETGDLEAAYHWFSEGMASLDRGGYTSDVIGGAVTLADIRIAQGRLGDALRLFEEGLRRATEAGPVPLRGAADMHVGIAEVLLARNDLAGAGERIAASRALGDDNGLPKNPSRWRVTLARIRAAGGDPAEAFALLDDALRVHFADFSPEVRPVAAVRARIQIGHGRLAEARAWATARGLTADKEPSYVGAFEQATLARLLVAEAARDGSAAALEAAVALADRLVAAAERGGHTGALLDASVVRAVAGAARGDASGARTALERALAIAEPEGYVRVFVDEGAPMRALLGELGRRGSAHATYARHLLAAFDGFGGDRSATPAGRGTLAEPLSERELEILRLLAGELSGPEIAGHLVLSLNTVRSHTKSIYGKLGVGTRRAAVRRASELGLLR